MYRKWRDYLSPRFNLNLQEAYQMTIKFVIPLCILLLGTVLVACHKPIISSQNQIPDSLTVIVQGINISENVSGKDELIVLGYTYCDSVLAAPLFAHKFYFSPQTGSRHFKFTWSDTSTPLLIVLLEEDSDTPIDSLDSLVRLHHVALRKAFSASQYLVIEKYLGDDDVLGIKTISSIHCQDPTVLTFAGLYKLDKYEYRITITCEN